MDTPLSTLDDDRAASTTARQHGRWLLGLLLGAILLVNLVALAVLSTGPKWPQPPGIAGMGLAFWQIGLAAVFVTWGGGKLWARSLLAVPLVLLAACQAAASTHVRVSVWLGIVLLDWALVALPLGVARIAGLRAVARYECPPRQGRQFTILGLLSLTTLVAALLGIARLTQIPRDDIGGVVLFALGQGSISWLCATMTLARLPWPVTLLATAIWCPLAGGLMLASGFPPPHIVELTAMCYVQGLLTLGVCEVVRIAGYRLVWRE